MGRMRGFVPVALAVGFGVLNGYVTFAPSFMGLEANKMHEKAHGEESAATSPPSQPKLAVTKEVATSEKQ
ncbi:hypothetical protein AJ78_02025 [Emergomyces pasteurianus Ep9510]|uniref:Uncharacterized protein n=1 Tax=Emergomyces pasteurianus Ep9510 TaxID=1447872 RepID=A0A1J9PN48_9EURO|nr:hypothetical protein AJ78_02025 [Emergomyces pasteurianus Ep9510]